MKYAWICLILVCICSSAGLLASCEKRIPPEASVGPQRDKAVLEWKQLGPFEADIQCLAASQRDPDTVYACHSKHVLRSTDGGHTWIYVDKGVSDKAPYIEVIMVNPRDPQTVYASTHDGISKSVDGGQTWKLVSSTKGYRESFVIREGPQGARFFSLAGEPQALYVSDDDCVTWRKVREIESGICVIVDPSDPATVMVGCDQQLLITRDSGATWTEISPPGAVGISEAAFNPTFTSVLYAWSQVAGLQRSHDGGKSWSELPRFPGPGSLARGPWVTSIRPIAGKPSRVLLGTSKGLFIGTDDGRVLEFEGTPRLSKRFVHDMIVFPPLKRVYAATDNGIYVSHDLGETWSVSLNGFRAHATYEIAASPSEPQVLFAMSPGSLFRSDDLGAFWEKLDVGSHSFAIDPGPPELIVASSGGVAARSTDEGDTWEPLGDIGLSKLWHCDGYLYGVFEPGKGGRRSLMRSADGGTSWEDLHLSVPSGTRINSVYVDPGGGRTLYVGIGNEFGNIVGRRPSPVGKIVVPVKIIRTLNDGATWLDIPEESEGFRPQLNKSHARIIAGSGRADGVLYAALRCDFSIAPASVVRSLDGGKTWEAFGDQSAMGRVESLVVDVGDDRVAFVGCTNGNVFATRDAGETWKPLAAGRDWGPVYDILPRPDDSDFLYIAASEGVFGTRL